MRGGIASGGARAAHGRHGRGARACVALLALGALGAASLEHVLHEHPHRQGQELSCAVCTAPLGETAAAPALLPPEARPTAPPLPPPPRPATVRAPLSFSPKQSPPPSA